MAEHQQGQPGADRAVGRPGPAARMNDPESPRPRPSVLIPPVGSVAGAPTRAPGATAGTAGTAGPMSLPPVTSATPPQAARPAPAQGSGGSTAAAAVGGAAVAAVAQPQRSSAPASTGSRPGAQPASPKAVQQRSQPAGAARVARTAVRPSMGPRSARVYLTHVDPWSVMKQAFLLSLALALILLAAAATLWFALESAGVIDAITRTATDVGGDSGASVSSYLSLGKVMGAALLIAGIETVLVTALATLFAFLYNLAVGIGGGLEITLSEED